MFKIKIMKELDCVLLVLVGILFIDLILGIINTINNKKAVKLNKKLLKNDNERLEHFKYENTREDVDDCHSIHKMQAQLLTSNVHDLNISNYVYSKEFEIGTVVNYYVRNKYNILEEKLGIIIKSLNTSCKVFTIIDNNPEIFIINKNNLEELSGKKLTKDISDKISKIYLHWNIDKKTGIVTAINK